MEPISQTTFKTQVGKLTPEALYVHIQALNLLPNPLQERVEEASLKTPSSKDANIVKIHRFKNQVSFLFYPTFDSKAHPVLTRSIVVNLDQNLVSTLDYLHSQNPPILHRKECFVGLDYPKREQFASLTQAEEKAGLYKSTSTIGTLHAWEELLAKKGLVIKGHQLFESLEGKAL